MKLLVLGAHGKLGSQVCEQLSKCHTVLGLGRAEADVTDIKALFSAAESFGPEVIVNAAAWTDVDGCEVDQDRAFLVNAIGARNVALVAREVGAKLFYISTDYVFDGQKTSPYKEYDSTAPVNFYGLSKLKGEEFVREQTPKHFILRVAWLYGSRGKDFLKTMLSLALTHHELRVVNDQWGTPTCVDDVVRQIEVLMHTELYGTYHCTAQGSCTWFEYALEIFKNLEYELSKCEDGVYEAKPSKQKGKGEILRIRPVSSREFPRPARRPRYSVLDNYLLRLQGLDVMPDWREALKGFFDRLRSRGGIYEGLGLGRG